MLLYNRGVGMVLRELTRDIRKVSIEIMTSEPSPEGRVTATSRTGRGRTILIWFLTYAYDGY